MGENYFGANEPEPYIPMKSDIENKADDDFGGMKIDSAEELEKRIEIIFSEICGEKGRKEFFQYVFPAIMQIYKDNYRKAGLRLLNIIDEGADKKPAEIGEYFKTVFSEAEIEYSTKDKKEIVRELVETIETLILEEKEKYRGEYKGVVAVLIYGSYAKGNFNLNSDIDIRFFTDEEEGEYFEEEEKYYHFGKEFQEKLEAIIRPPMDPDTESEGIPIKKIKEKLLDYMELFRGGFIVVSPYSEIKQEIEKKLKEMGC